MTAEEIKKLTEEQRRFFETGATLELSYRIQALKRLKACVKKREEEILAALKRDLGKSRTEGYMCEVGLTLSEIGFMLSHIRRYAAEKRVHTPLAQFPSRSYVKPSPYGVTLVMSPWNYPFLLTMEPLADALAAGNTVILKPSAYSPHTGKVIAQIVEECFDKKLVAVVTGGRAENTCLLQQHFDYIFFTGSQAVGKEVMTRASEHLTPVTLELGGKSPCLVDKTADLSLAAKRIVFGKFLNCGQTCVAPDYVYCDKAVKEELLWEIQKQILRQFGPDPLDNPDYGKIINRKHFDRLCRLIKRENVVAGGQVRETSLQIAPTVMQDMTFSDAVMQEEIFGPLMPVLTYDSLEEAIERIRTLPHPLALYLFTKSRKNAKKVMACCGFGGGCINDTVIHLATSEMGFGGFGESGMGSYHGKAGFLTFSHQKSIVDKKLWLDLPMRYQPYRKIYDGLIRLFLR